MTDRALMRALSLEPGLLVEDRDANVGIGRVAGTNGAAASIAYFDHPGDGGLVTRTVPASRLRRAYLSAQTRVHFRDGDGQWRHGRVLSHDTDTQRVEVRLPRGIDVLLHEADVLVRWQRRLPDATQLLADAWVESRRFYDARTAFVSAYLARASAYQGLTAISSAAIEMHPHQLEAMRRVMTDVAPRYLLADEVGLGKTIEAALLIRQHLSDATDTRVLVIVPAALVLQWQDELSSKFHIQRQFPDRCSIVSLDAFARMPPDPSVTMAVVDEAHRLTVASALEAIYDRLRRLAHDVDVLILLSATPLLQEPAGLLRLLHLLAPEAHPLDDIATFERALAARDEIGAYVANLTTDVKPVFLRSALNGLADALAEDARLVSLLRDVEVALDAEDHDATERAVRQARAHVTEAHRIATRMIRTRRGSGLAEDFPVLGRDAPVVERVTGSVAEVATPFVAWHDYALSLLQTCDPQTRPEHEASIGDVVRALSTPGRGLVHAVRARQAAADGLGGDEPALLADLEVAADARAAACPRFASAIALALDALSAGEKVALAAGSDDAAEDLAILLRAASPGKTIAHISADESGAGTTFRLAAAPAALVFGESGEEGQNLQAAGLVIHLDLPWDPNRLEQRLGRFDRFGAGLPANQVVLLDDVDTIASAWFDVLRDGFSIFSGSLSSVQLAVEALMPGLLDTSTAADPKRLRAESERVAEALEEELATIEMAELLDETMLDDRGRRLVESVDEAEGAEETKAWAEAVVRWAAADGADAAHLRFHHRVERFHHRFMLTPFDRPVAAAINTNNLPLIPLTDLVDRFSGAMDEGGATSGTFRRLTAVAQELRLFGPGDPFIDALWTFTELDDRGRAFAVWRQREHWAGREDGLAVGLDVRVRPDIEQAAHVVSIDVSDAARAALRRRAESYLAPTTVRVWFNARGRELESERLLTLLNAPYSDRLGDQTIRPDAWHLVSDHVGVQGWAHFCATLRDRAEAAISTRPGFQERCRTAADQALFDSKDGAARLFARADEGQAHAPEAELRLGQALADGMLAPDFEVDAAGVVIMSSKPLPRDDD